MQQRLLKAPSNERQIAKEIILKTRNVIHSKQSLTVGPLDLEGLMCIILYLFHFQDYLSGSLSDLGFECLPAQNYLISTSWILSVTFEEASVVRTSDVHKSTPVFSIASQTISQIMTHGQLLSVLHLFI